MKKNQKPQTKKLPTMQEVLKTIRKEDSWSNDFWDYKEEHDQHKQQEDSV